MKDSVEELSNMLEKACLIGFEDRQLCLQKGFVVLQLQRTSPSVMPSYRPRGGDERNFPQREVSPRSTEFPIAPSWKT